MCRTLQIRKRGLAKKYYDKRENCKTEDYEKNHSNAVCVGTSTALGHFADGVTQKHTLKEFCKWLARLDGVDLPSVAKIFTHSLYLMTCVAAEEPLPAGTKATSIFEAPGKLGALGQYVDSLRLGRSIKLAASSYVDKSEEDLV